MFNPTKYITGFIQNKITGVFVGKLYDFALNFLKEYAEKNNKSFVLTFDDDNDPVLLVTEKDKINDLINNNINIVDSVINIAEYKQNAVDFILKTDFKNIDIDDLENIIDNKNKQVKK